MSLQDVAPRLMQPRNQDQFVPHFHSQQCFRESRFNLEPCVRRAFRSLPLRVFTAFNCRSNEANRLHCLKSSSCPTLFTLPATQLPANAPTLTIRGNGEETSDDPRSPRKLLRYLWLGTATYGLAKRRGRRDNRTCRELRHRAASRTSISKRPLAASDRAWR